VKKLKIKDASNFVAGLLLLIFLHAVSFPITFLFLMV